MFGVGGAWYSWSNRSHGRRWQARSQRGRWIHGTSRTSRRDCESTFFHTCCMGYERQTGPRKLASFQGAPGNRGFPGSDGLPGQKVRNDWWEIGVACPSAVLSICFLALTGSPGGKRASRSWWCQRFVWRPRTQRRARSNWSSGITDIGIESLHKMIRFKIIIVSFFM